MSDDEIIVLVLSMCSALLMGLFWCLMVWRMRIAAYPGGWRIWLGWAPVASAVSILIALKVAAAQDVRNAVQYLILYTAMGSVWVLAAMCFLPLLGLSYRDDAVERRNPAAALVMLCAMAALSAIYAGANIGDGPGWWVVVFSSFIGTAAWFVLLWAVLAFSGAGEGITVGRDFALAIRLGGWMIAAGIALGRGAAGDWESPGATVHDFWTAWPALALAVAFIVVERVFKGASNRGSVYAALAQAAVMVGLSIAWISVGQPLSENPYWDIPWEQRWALEHPGETLGE